MMENKWYKYGDRILNLSVFDEFTISEVIIIGQKSYEILCGIGGQTKDWFKYPTKEEAQDELEKIYNILSK